MNMRFRVLAGGVTLALTTTILFVGCAPATLSDADACAELLNASEKWSAAMRASRENSDTVEELRESTSFAEQYVDEMREVNAPPEIGEMRDRFVAVLDRMHEASDAGTLDDDVAELLADLAGPQVDLDQHCAAVLP
jgi:hypothetical protein